MTQAEYYRLTHDLFTSEIGEKWLKHTQNEMFRETPTSTDNTNEYILIDGKRRVIQDINIMIQGIKDGK